MTRRLGIDEDSRERLTDKIVGVKVILIFSVASVYIIFSPSSFLFFFFLAKSRSLIGELFAHSATCNYRIKGRKIFGGKVVQKLACETHICPSSWPYTSIPISV